MIIIQFGRIEPVLFQEIYNLLWVVSHQRHILIEILLCWLELPEEDKINISRLLFIYRLHKSNRFFISASNY
jgi:hypothetical protein